MQSEPVPVPEKDPTTFSQMAAKYKTDDYQNRLDYYQKHYRGKQIEWEAVVVQPAPPDGYQIAPLDDVHSDFKVRALYDPSNPVTPLKKGDKIKIEAIIDDVYSSGVRLRNLKILEQLN